MKPNGLMLCSLVLNEMEWLPKLWLQHKDWPDLKCWAFVEAADPAYAKANPEMVSCEGLSVDGTSEFLAELQRRDERVVLLTADWRQAGSAPDDQHKCGIRNVYMELAEEVRPELLVVLDGDEFYTRQDQERVCEHLRARPDRRSIIFPIRHPWHPPYWQNVGYRTNVFQEEVQGGFWSIPHCHWWRWEPGLRYGSNHNSPQDRNGGVLNLEALDLRKAPDVPQMVHMAFASSPKVRRAKHRYYEARGEARDPRRGWYTQSRKAWEEWVPGAALPRGAQVVPYDGPVPESLQGG